MPTPRNPKPPAAPAGETTNPENPPAAPADQPLAPEQLAAELDGDDSARNVGAPDSEPLGDVAEDRYNRLMARASANTRKPATAPEEE